MRKIIQRLAVFATMGLTATALVAGCNALLGIHDLPPSCTSDADCDSNNPCMADSCGGDGLCQHQPLDGEVAAVKQTPGNCMHTSCAQGQPVDRPDDTNLPVDANPCDQRLCNHGAPATPAQPKNSACSLPADPLAKLCDGAGNCVECNAIADCTNLLPDSDCHQATCVGGKCVPKYAAEGTAVNATLQAQGNCQKVVCDGHGGTKSIADDTNKKPSAPNDCLDYTCTNGSLTKPPYPKDYACGAMGALYCDGAGKCVGCNEAAECGKNTDCQTWACTANACVPTNAAGGALAPNDPGEKPNDCQTMVCDGNGGSKSIADAGDLPLDDGSGCTTPTCNNGSPEHPPKALDAACNVGMGKYCDGNGKCVPCNNAGECNKPPDCQYATCKMNSCGVANTMAGVAANDQSAVVGTCQKKVCDGNGNVSAQTVEDDTNLPACMNNGCVARGCNMGSPTCTPLALNAQAAGKCDNANGCANPPCGCNNAAYPNSACLSLNGSTCAAGATCLSGFCADSVCCNSACTGACDACDATGTCKAASVKNATNPNDCDATHGCATMPCTCDSNGVCNSQNGATCANGGTCASTFCVDGVCCNVACTAPCAACSMAMGAAANGTCMLNAVQGKQDPGRCDNTNGNCNGADPCTCDGGGNCKVVTGQTCTMASQCASGFCMDGVCCATACNGACDKCGAGGVCTANGMTNATRPGTCDANNGGCGAACSCNGSGTCLRAQGQACTMATQCATGNCPTDDGVCCDSACAASPVCSACSKANGASADGTCTMNAVKPNTVNYGGGIFGGPDPDSCHDAVGCPAGAGVCFCDSVHGWCCNSGNLKCYTM